jgi:hypothetical protein
MAEKSKDKAKKTGAVVPRRESSELSPWGNLDRMFEDFLERRFRPSGRNDGDRPRLSKFPRLLWMFMKRKTTSWLKRNFREWKRITST